MNWQPPGFQPPGFQPPNWQPESGGGGGASAFISGTVIVNFLEADIVVGGDTIIIDLSGDIWVASGAAFNAIRQDILDGMNSVQSEATGWNAEVRDKQDVSAVARISDSQVIITLLPSAAYDISTSENIIPTIPASAVVAAAAIIATPAFSVTEDNTKGMQPVSGRKPRTRKISIRSASHHLAGPEQPYPVYQFSDRTFIGRKGHNPFKGL